MKYRFTHLFSLTLLSAFVILAYASSPSPSDFGKRKNKGITEKSIMNDPNLSDKEKEEIITKRRAKFDKERENNTIQALVLAEEYENNEVSADVKYKNKILFVDGVIEDISKDLFDKIFITLEGYELFGSVTCYVNDPEKVMTLSKGMRIVVRGRCDGTLLGVNMNDCEIIEVFESEEDAESIDNEEGI
ncbi:MAG: hypothetical protein COA38_19365 [Fluviicola sp.]|nr:MAG: hypothetical protein COA38_19365 [Fluviicola sp.]